MDFLQFATYLPLKIFKGLLIIYDRSKSMAFEFGCNANSAVVQPMAFYVTKA